MTQATNLFNLANSGERQDQQVIIPNWEQELRNRLAWALSQRDEAWKKPPGEEFNKRWNEYARRCNEVVRFIAETYGSINGLQALMKAELRGKAAPYGIFLDDKLGWEIQASSMPKGQENIGVIEGISTSFEFQYDEVKHHINRAIEALTANQVRLENT